MSINQRPRVGLWERAPAARRASVNGVAVGIFEDSLGRALGGLPRKTRADRVPSWRRLAGTVCAAALAWVLLGGGQALASSSASYFKGLGGGSPWLAEARQGAAAATLADGQVLVVGGENLAEDVSSAELFNPATDTFTALAQSSPIVGRGAVAATLPNGQVLVAGGEKANGVGVSSSAELFNPAADTFTALPGTLAEPRFEAVAATLPNGQVLIAGGSSNSAHLSSAELFNPATDSFTKLAGTLTEARWGAVAATLRNGQVLIAGGESGRTYTASSSAELFNPASDTFTKLAGSLAEARLGAVAATLPNGEVLIAGETAPAGSSSAELFNSATDTFTKLTGSDQSPGEPRESAVAATLPGGHVLIAGGRAPGEPLNAVSSAEVFNASTDTFTGLQGGGQSPSEPRSRAAAAALPNGEVLIAGGVEDVLGGALSSAELFRPSTGSFTRLQGSGGSLTERRSAAVAATLPNGDVLIAGGYGGGSATGSSAELFNPTMDTFRKLTGAGQSPTEPREYAVAAALSDGQVLIAGGEQKERALLSAELFNPVTDTFAKLSGPHESLTEPRAAAVAATLANGQVLIAGGVDDGTLSSAEVFNPETDTFTKLTGVGESLAEPREDAVAASLPDDEIMIAGGANTISGSLRSAELFDPATNTFMKLAGNMQALAEARSSAVAAALPNGQVLIAGGDNAERPVARTSMSSAELFLAAPEARVAGGTFSGAAVGKRSTSLLTVQDVGAQALSITGASLGGAHGFTLAADGCAHVTLTLHQRCTIELSFTAQAPGAARATLALGDNEPQPTVVSLSATAPGYPAAAEVLACTARAIKGLRHKQLRCSARLPEEPRDVHGQRQERQGDAQAARQGLRSRSTRPHPGHAAIRARPESAQVAPIRRLHTHPALEEPAKTMHTKRQRVTLE